MEKIKTEDLQEKSKLKVEDNDTEKREYIDSIHKNTKTREKYEQLERLKAKENNLLNTGKKNRKKTCLSAKTYFMCIYLKQMVKDGLDEWQLNITIFR